MKQIFLSRGEIQSRILVLSRNPKYLSREQIRLRIQELAKSNQFRYPKNAVRG